MTARSILVKTALFFLVSSSLSCGKGSATDDEVAVMETNYGRVVIEFLPQYAPDHVENFKKLTRQGFYNGTKIHRIVRDKTQTIAIQGGDPNTISGDPSTWGRGQPAQQTVDAEFSTNVKHERGIVSAARRADDVNSATSQFFICVAPMPQWDGNYSIYGKVVEGINVVDTIARAPLQPNSDKPLDPVVVSRVYLTKRGDVH
jgi:peptidyl-prolyl cis-trans isomerase B (cyclophilin B)